MSLSQLVMATESLFHVEFGREVATWILVADAIAVFTSMQNGKLLKVSCDERDCLKNASLLLHDLKQYFDSITYSRCQAFSVIGCLVGGTAVVPLVCACGKKLLMSQVVSMSGSCMWCCLFSGLTLLMLNSSACSVDSMANESCGLGVGAKLAIASTVLFFITSISMNCTFMAAVIAQEMEAQHAEPDAAAAAGGGDPEEGATEDK